MLLLSLLATVLWTGDYETGDVSQWAGFEGLASRLTVVQSPVRQVVENWQRADLHPFVGIIREIHVDGATLEPQFAPGRQSPDGK